MLILLLLLLGQDILREEHFKLMKDKAIVCNIGHLIMKLTCLNNNNYGNKIEIKPQVDLGKLMISKSWMRH